MNYELRFIYCFTMVYPVFYTKNTDLRIGKLVISCFVDVLLQNILKITKMRLKFNYILLLVLTAVLSACNDMKDMPTPVDLPLTPRENRKIVCAFRRTFQYEQQHIKPAEFRQPNH